MKYILDYNGPEALIDAIFVKAAFDYRAARRKHNLKETNNIESFFNLTNKGKVILEGLQGEEK